MQTMQWKAIEPEPYENGKTLTQRTSKNNLSKKKKNIERPETQQERKLGNPVGGKTWISQSFRAEQTPRICP